MPSEGAASKQYRNRLYAAYGRHFQDSGHEFDTDASVRWGTPYRHYLHGWLPTHLNAEIVELACGGGRLLHFLNRAGYQQLTGVDISPDQIALSRQVTPNVVHSDVISFLEQKPDSFDLVIGLDIIEHFTKPEVLRVLDLSFGALRPGGRLILQTPNAESPWGLTHRYNDFSHEVCFNPNALSRLLQLVGFAQVESREAGPVPVGVSLSSSIRAFAWTLIRCGLKIWNIAETGHIGSGIYTRVFLISAIKN